VSVVAKLSGVLMPEDAPRYASLAPEDFVKTRFFDEEQSAFLDGVDVVSKKLDQIASRVPSRGASAYRHKEEISKDGSTVTWPAYFTDANFIQLARPAIDIKRYCEATGASWELYQPYTDDPIAGMNRNPIFAYLDAQNRVSRYLAANGAFAGAEEVQNAVASNIGMEMLEEAEHYNSRVNAQFSSRGFEAALRAKTFGVFRCQSLQDGKTWFVSILPAVLIPRSGTNQLSSSIARLALRVYRSGVR